jgi:hypothetical protein
MSSFIGRRREPTGGLSDVHHGQLKQRYGNPTAAEAMRTKAQPSKRREAS